jgi:hypothetical protein
MPIVPEHFCDLGEKPARIHVALPRLTAYEGDEDAAVLRITPSLYDTGGRIVAAGATCSASDSISFSKNESESEKSGRIDS